MIIVPTVLDLVEDLYENRRGITYPYFPDYEPNVEQRKGRTEREWFDVVVATAATVPVWLPDGRRNTALYELNRDDYTRLFTACGGDRTPRVRMCPGCGVNPAATCECGMEDI